MTNNEYWTEITSIAESLVEDAMEYCDQDRRAAEEYINETTLLPVIFEHKWHIYSNRPLDMRLLRRSILEMKADVKSRLDTAFEAYEGE